MDKITVFILIAFSGNTPETAALWPEAFKDYPKAYVSKAACESVRFRVMKKLNERAETDAAWKDWVINTSVCYPIKVTKTDVTLEQLKQEGKIGSPTPFYKEIIVTEACKPGSCTLPCYRTEGWSKELWDVFYKMCPALNKEQPK